jgi:C-terminal processing protease CtpA/Prc
MNDWGETPMTRQDDGTWSVALELEPGRYEYKYFVDEQWPRDMETDHDGGPLDPAADSYARDGYHGQNAVRLVGGAEHFLEPGAPVEWANPDHSADDWRETQLPKHMEFIDTEYPPGFSGVMWFRREIEIPAGWAGRELTLELGPIDDTDVTWFEGELVGRTTADQPNHWNLPRTYTVPGDLVAEGEATLVVRAKDIGGPGGFIGTPDQMHIGPSDDAADRLTLAGTWLYEVESEIPFPELSAAERAQGLAQCYWEAKQSFSLFHQVPELDWDEAYAEFMPLVLEEQDILSYYRLLQKFMALMRDGHTNAHMPGRVWESLDRLPLDFEWIEERWVVTRRWPVEEILAEDVPVGSVLLSIDGRETSEYLEAEIYPYIGTWATHHKRYKASGATSFPVNAAVDVSLRKPDGTEVTRTLRANSSTIRWTPELREEYYTDPPLPGGFAHRAISDDIHYMRFDGCTAYHEDRVTAVMDSLADEGRIDLILDIRWNGGGSDPRRIARRLMDREIVENVKCRWTSVYLVDRLEQVPPDALPMIFNVPRWVYSRLEADPEWIGFTYATGPDKANRYRGDVVLLVDNSSISAAEDLVAVLRHGSDVTIMGEPTAGSLCQSYGFALPGGGSFSLGTNRGTMNGELHPCQGYEPDVLVPRTIQGIIEGRDEQLEAAIERLEKG